MKFFHEFFQFACRGKNKILAAGLIYAGFTGVELTYSCRGYAFDHVAV